MVDNITSTNIWVDTVTTPDVWTTQPNIIWTTDVWSLTTIPTTPDSQFIIDALIEMIDEKKAEDIKPTKVDL